MEELLCKLEDLQHRHFMIQMIDHWSAQDYKDSRELWEEIKKVKTELKEKYKLEENENG